MKKKELFRLILATFQYAKFMLKKLVRLGLKKKVQCATTKTRVEK